jgi:hypothetical protein
MTKSISPANAYKLSLWLAHEHPQLFALVHAKVTAMKASGQLSGLGCNCGPSGQRSRRVGTFGRLGDTGFTFPSGSTSSFDVGNTSFPGTTGITSWDNSIGSTALPSSVGGTGSTGLQSIGTTAAQAAGSTGLTTSIASGSTGFWGSFASDVGSLGSAVAPAIADVAGALTAPSTLAAVGSAVAAYYATEPRSTAAQTTATQVARTAAGQSPAAIAGNTLYGADGSTSPLSSSLLSSLTPGEQSLLIPILLIGAIALVMLS